MREHLNKPIPSPAVLGQVTSRFREDVLAFAAENAIPLTHFERGERKDDRANEIHRECGIRGGVVHWRCAGKGEDLFGAQSVREGCELVRVHPGQDGVREPCSRVPSTSRSGPTPSPPRAAAPHPAGGLSDGRKTRSSAGESSSRTRRTVASRSSASSGLTSSARTSPPFREER